MSQSFRLVNISKFQLGVIIENDTDENWFETLLDDCYQVLFELDENAIACECLNSRKVVDEDDG